MFDIRTIRSAGIDRSQQNGLELSFLNWFGEALPCARVDGFDPEIHLGLGDQEHDLGFWMTFLKRGE